MRGSQDLVQGGAQLEGLLGRPTQLNNIILKAESICVMIGCLRDTGILIFVG